MNESLALTTIVSLASSVLAIILFFKIWSMTNDVRSLKRHVADKEKHHECAIRIAIAKKDPNIESILFDALFTELYYVYRDGEGYYKNIVEKYEIFYKKAGVDFPKELDIHSQEDFINYLD